MKRFILSVFCVAALAGCGSGSDGVQARLDEFAEIEIGSSFFEGISDNGREVLNYFKLASAVVDDIYWQQSFGDRQQLTGLGSRALKDFAALNYGPWNRIDGQSFVEGWGERPLGANFYPADMTAEEFAAWDEPLKNSPYTLVRRDAEGKLTAVWYHDAYAAEIEKICNYLASAANYTIKESVHDYLEAKIAGLQTDDYYAGDVLWLSMDDSKMDLIIGPQETEDDRLLDIKASYESYVLLKDLELTAKVNGFTAMIPALQESLPCDAAYKTFAPGAASTIFVYDEVYGAGSANAGVKKIAVNLPYDLRVQEEQGTRTAVFNNVINAKFNKIILPAGRLLLASDQTKHLSRNAFFWNTALREVAHGIGVKETVNGLGSVSEALGDAALAVEEIKGDVLGLYLDLQLIAAGEMDPTLTREDAITTFVVGLIRSSRFGEASALGKANIVIYNYLKEKEAFGIEHNGRCRVDYDKAEAAVAELASKVLELQATGDRAAALALVGEYGTTPETLSQSFAGLQQARIPIDVRFSFVW